MAVNGIPAARWAAKPPQHEQPPTEWVKMAQNPNGDSTAGRTWLVTGEATHPDGYHDHLYYQGTSTWQAIKAVIIGLRNEMRITIERKAEC